MGVAGASEAKPTAFENVRKDFWQVPSEFAVGFQNIIFVSRVHKGGFSKGGFSN